MPCQISTNSFLMIVFSHCSEAFSIKSRGPTGACKMVQKCDCVPKTVNMFSNFVLKKTEDSQKLHSRSSKAQKRQASNFKDRISNHNFTPGVVWQGYKTQNSPSGMRLIFFFFQANDFHYSHCSSWIENNVSSSNLRVRREACFRTPGAKRWPSCCVLLHF